MKKLLAVLLAIITILSVCGFSTYAENTVPADVTVGGEITDDPTVPDTPDTPDVPDEPDEPDEPVPTLDDYEYVVTMYICATANSLTGHIWLYFENLTECDVPIGYTMLAPHKGMSVGSLRNTRKDGGGTYYNGEAMMASLKGKLDKVRDHTYTLKMDLTLDQLNTVNGKIKSKNAYEMIFYNCGVFATSVWNSVSSKKVVHIVLPIFTILNMSILGAKRGELRMQDPDVAYKQTDDGCYVADNKSFKLSCV